MDAKLTRIIAIEFYRDSIDLDRLKELGFCVFPHETGIYDACYYI